MIVLMIEAVSTLETSGNFNDTTRRNVPEENNLHARLEYVKSHID
jgi:hypothetical protein